MECRPTIQIDTSTSTLTLLGVILDRVSRLSEPLGNYLENRLLSHIASWLKEKKPPFRIPYPTGACAMYVIWQTLGAVTPGGHSHAKELRTLCARLDKPAGLLTGDEDAPFEPWRVVYPDGRERVVWATRDGFCGLLPMHNRVGDFIVIFDSGVTPFAVREQGEILCSLETATSMPSWKVKRADTFISKLATSLWSRGGKIKHQPPRLRSRAI